MVRFKFDSVDTLGARTGIIDNQIPTPIRVLTSREVNFADKIENKNLATINFMHPVAEYYTYFTPDRLLSLGKKENSEAWGTEKDELQKFVVRFEEKEIIFQPSYNDYITKKEGKKRVIIGKIEVSDKIHAALLEMQLQVSDPGQKPLMDVITIQDIHPTSDPTKFEKRIVDSREVIEESENGITKNPMPTLSIAMKETKLNEKIDAVLDNSFKDICFKYASVKTYMPNYMHIRKIAQNHNIRIHLIGVPRVWRVNKRTSLIHVMPLFGFDTLSPKVPKPLAYETTFKLVPEIAQRFDNETLGLPQESEYKQMHGTKLNCKESLCKDRTIEDFMNTYYASKCLRQALDVHESIDSLKEFLISRKFIRDNEHKNYLRDKKYAKEGVKGILGYDLKSSLLKW